MNKKILYVRADIHNKPLIAGGSITHTLGVIKGFTQLGYSVSAASTVLHEQLQKLSVTRIAKLEHPRLFKLLGTQLNCILSNIFFTQSIINLIRQEQPAVLYQRYSVLNCSGVLASVVEKIPLILEFNGSEVWVAKHWTKKKLSRHLFLWAIKLIEQYNLKKARYIVVVSQVLADQLIAHKIDPKKIIVCPNGVDTEEYNPKKLINERNKVRAQLNVQNKFVLGFIGTFSAWHGINVLQQIIPEIVTKNMNIHFLLIGDGPLLKSLKENLFNNNVSPQHVTFTGALPQGDAKQYLAACDAFLSPTQPNPDGSLFFGSPTKLFEYLSLGKPVIASDIAQIAEIIDSTNGFLVQPTNAQQFSQTIVKCAMLPPEEQRILGNNARKKAEQQYQWIHQVKKIDAFMKGRTNESRSA